MVEKVINKNITAKTKRAQSDSSMLHDSTMEYNFVRRRLEQFQISVIKNVEQRISGMIDEVMQELRQKELQQHEFRNFTIPALQQREQHKHHQHHQDQLRNTWNNRTLVDGFNEIKSETLHRRNKKSKDDDISTQSDKSSTTSSQKSKQKKGKQQQEVVQGKARTLPDKVFITRESYLTALLEVDHMRTIYHIFYIILLWFLMHSICYDYFVEGRVNFGLGTFKSGLNKIDKVAGIWLLEHVFVFALYYAFKCWASVRNKLHKQASLQSFWSNCCIIIYISSQLIFYYIACVLCLRLDLPFVTASVLLLESTRLLMKMHAFVRSNAPRVLAARKLRTATLECSECPAFGKYLYFLFAPTIVYRDSYPRTSQIRWKFAISRFLEVVAIAFLYSYIHERHIKAHFWNYGREEMSASMLVVKLFSMIMPSIVILLCGFYLILHSWLNFTSELLRFGDRMFYKDWWTVSSYDAYYRNWNMVIHDWLYEYIYKDCYAHLIRGSKLAASLMVFTVSAVVHELILGFALQLFFPVIFSLFGLLGVSLVYLTRRAPKRIGNLFIWFSLIFGSGVMISLYSMEYYAVRNCPKTYNSWTDYFIPAVWSCYN